MQKGGKTVHIVPVCVNYERVFEVRNLAVEMVSGKVPKLGFIKLLQMLASEKEGHLGRAFITYGDSINLKDYLTKNLQLTAITPENIDTASLKISEKLYKEQQQMTHACLSWVVASVLLQEQSKHLDLSTLQKSCERIFEYMHQRGLNTSITLNPSVAAITRIVRKLGFKV